MSKRQIGHPLTRTMKRVQQIPRVVRSSEGGGRRLGHLTCATVPESGGGNWSFGLQKEQKCGRDHVRQLKWHDNICAFVCQKVQVSNKIAEKEHKSKKTPSKTSASNHKSLSKLSRVLLSTASGGTIHSEELDTVDS